MDGPPTSAQSPYPQQSQSQQALYPPQQQYQQHHQYSQPPAHAPQSQPPQQVQQVQEQDQQYSRVPTPPPPSAHERQADQPPEWASQRQQPAFSTEPKTLVERNGTPPPAIFPKSTSTIVEPPAQAHPTQTTPTTHIIPPTPTGVEPSHEDGAITEDAEPTASATGPAPMEGVLDAFRTPTTGPLPPEPSAPMKRSKSTESVDLAPNGKKSKALPASAASLPPKPQKSGGTPPPKMKASPKKVPSVKLEDEKEKEAGVVKRPRSGSSSGTSLISGLPPSLRMALDGAGERRKSRDGGDGGAEGKEKEKRPPLHPSTSASSVTPTTGTPVVASVEKVEKVEKARSASPFGARTVQKLEKVENGKGEREREREGSPVVLSPVIGVGKSAGVPSPLVKVAGGGAGEQPVFKPPSFANRRSGAGGPGGPGGGGGGGMNGRGGGGGGGMKRERERVEDSYPGLFDGVGQLRQKLKTLVDANPDVQTALEALCPAPSTTTPIFKPRPSLTQSPSTMLLPSSLSAPTTKVNLATPPDPTTFKLQLSVPVDYNSSCTGFGKAKESVKLQCCHVVRRSGYPTFLFEEEYEVDRLLPRGFFGVMSSMGVVHSFVFEVAGGSGQGRDGSGKEGFFLGEMCGLRRTICITLKIAGVDDPWELHLKHSRERTNLMGYLIRSIDLRNSIQAKSNQFLLSRRLPLVLDLDDTLVRVVGDGDSRYVPEDKVGLCDPSRVRKLADGRRVVIGDRVEEFLEWASKLFEISICSLGDQSYVDMVIAVLDPQRSRIKGVGYSARQEFLFIQGSRYPRRPPKDLVSLFPFCARGGIAGVLEWDVGVSVDPVVVDDNGGMWGVEQQDHIIVVRETRATPVWNVQFFPIVRDTLFHIHQEFFRQFDAWGGVAALNSVASSNGGSGGGVGGGAVGGGVPAPSACRIYKEMLRNELGRRIGEPVVGNGGSNGGGGGGGEDKNASGSASASAAAVINNML
ncbi:hypothetical protein HDU97_002680 [Phlyctochytrium planicorne]|nr:hypothetical protein HDU97_002680 [Phlyctochytrium planicorne]